MAPRWRELVVPCPDPALAETLFVLFEDGGAPGAAYERPTDVILESSRHPEGVSPRAERGNRFGTEGPAARVVAYLPEGADTQARVDALRARVDGLGMALVDRVIEETDWAEAWKQFFKPTRIGERLIVCPSWETPDARPGDIVLDLDPGQAFGTGDHPTTRMMLQMLERRMQPGWRVFDIGVGSGILAIAAAKLGARSVACCDVESASVQAARANFERNGVADRSAVVLSEGLGWLRGQADLVMSNIISATLVRLAPEVARCVRPGGVWLLSGVIVDNEGVVAQAAELAGMRIAEREVEDQWVAMAATR